MKRAELYASLAMAVVFLLGLTTLAAGQSIETREVTFLTPVQIAGTPFAPGTYRITHSMEGQDHVLVLTSNGSKKPHPRKVRCHVKSLPKKSAYSEQRFVEDSSGKRTITSMVFEGDEQEYVF